MAMKKKKKKAAKERKRAVLYLCDKLQHLLNHAI
jgi:hypothetical protein